MKILVLNPGSTSTKAAVYEDDVLSANENVAHSVDVLSKFSDVLDQLDYRFGIVKDFLKRNNLEMKDIDCVVSRGGTPRDVHSGATIIDDRLVDSLIHRPKQKHPSNLGPLIADKIAKENKIPAYIYDPISTFELNEYARVWGVKGIERDSMCHVLNARAVTLEVARENGKTLQDFTAITVQIGGGNSISLWKNGLLTDVVPCDEGVFSAERCGMLRAERILDLVEEYGIEQMRKWCVGKGGFVSLLGTNSIKEIEERIVNEDKEAEFYMKAFSYQMARYIASLYTPVKGEVDGLIFTGGGANWKRMIHEVLDYLSFLSPKVYLKPGEREMDALAQGALRVMRGEETAHIYEG